MVYLQPVLVMNTLISLILLSVMGAVFVEKCLDRSLVSLITDLHLALSIFTSPSVKNIKGRGSSKASTPFIVYFFSSLYPRRAGIGYLNTFMSRNDRSRTIGLSGSGRYPCSALREFLPYEFDVGRNSATDGQLTTSLQIRVYKLFAQPNQSSRIGLLELVRIHKFDCFLGRNLSSGSNSIADHSTEFLCRLILF